MSEDSAVNPPPLPAPLTKPTRPDLIETAVKFLQDPQVKSAPLSKRLAFLESKGLTADEINLALLKASSDEPGPKSSNGIAIEKGNHEIKSSIGEGFNLS